MLVQLVDKPATRLLQTHLIDNLPQVSQQTVDTLRPGYTCDFFLAPATQRVKFHCVARASDKISRVSYLARQRNCNRIRWAIVAES